jgi:hypothetical protein
MEDITSSYTSASDIVIGASSSHSLEYILKSFDLLNDTLLSEGVCLEIIYDCFSERHGVDLMVEDIRYLLIGNKSSIDLSVDDT